MSGWPAHSQTPTHAQIGRMSAMLTKFSLAVTGTHIHTIGHPRDVRPVLSVGGNSSGSQSRQSQVRADENDNVENDTPNEDANITQIGNVVTEGTLHPSVPEWAQETVRSRFKGSPPYDDCLTEDIQSEEKKAYYGKVCLRFVVNR